LEDLLFVLILYSTGRENYFTLPWYLKWTIRENTWWYDQINSFVTYRPIENCRNMLLSKALKCRISNRLIPKWMWLLQLAYGWWEESIGAWLSVGYQWCSLCGKPIYATVESHDVQVEWTGNFNPYY
jgi:hypothetical protein